MLLQMARFHYFLWPSNIPFFTLISFLYCSSAFHFTDFCPSLYYFLSSAYFEFNLLFFPLIS